MDESTDKDKKIGMVHNNFVASVLDDRFIAGQFLAALLPDWLTKGADWSRLETDSTVFIDENLKQHLLDLTFSVPAVGSDARNHFVLIIEHKSTKDEAASIQMFGYCGLKLLNLHRTKRRLANGQTPWPIPILFYTGAKPWDDTSTFSELVGIGDCPPEVAKKIVPNFDYLEIDLSKIDPAKCDAHAFVRIFLDALKRGSQGTLVDDFKNLKLPWDLDGVDWNKDFDAIFEALITKTLNYISYTAHNNGESLSAEDFQNALVGTQNGKVKTTMKTFVDEYFERGLEQGRAAGREEGREEGRAEGRAEGREEGLAMGRAETIYASIQKYATKRFENIPPQLLAKINAVNDYPTLEKIQDCAIDAVSLEEFERFVNLLTR